MLHDKNILVVDDSEPARASLKVVLDFIGEHCEHSTLTDWQARCEGRSSDSGCQGSAGEVGSNETNNISSDEATAPCDKVGLILLGQTEGVELKSALATLHDLHSIIPIVLIGEHGSADDISDPHMRHMVVARLSLPLNYNDLNDAIHRAQTYNEAQLAAALQKGQRPSHLFRSLVGTSRLVKGVRAMMSQVADSDVTVLIEGESGTGKEVVARNLHYHSSRREGPFVPVNCGAIPGELLESELFGHEKGAFTGAVNARAGRFELAEGGTLFLDEIGDMPLHMQVKILRVLQEKSFERVGGNKSYKTNVRIIAATHRNLETMIEEGRFREDLYYRLNVFPIEMPSLRERAEDVPLLINELVLRLENEKRGSIRFNSAAILSLCRHQWPGNVRELANLVERMAIMQPYGVVGAQDLPKKYRHVEVDEEEQVELQELESQAPSMVNAGDTVLLPEEGIDLKEYIMGLEQSLIQQALDNAGGVVARAAEQLMIRRTTLVEKMKKYGMQRG